MRNQIMMAFVASFVACGASAEEYKIATFNALSGPASAPGKMFQAAQRFALKKLDRQKTWPGGMELMEYDDQGNASEAASRLRDALAKGAKLIIHGGSSAVTAQISEDVRRYNLRNPGKEVLLLNMGGDAMEMTGTKCHFHHFHLSANAAIKTRALLVAMKQDNALQGKVYSIQQNYSWGQDVAKNVADLAGPFSYNVVGQTLHDVNRIQDFSPYVASIRTSGADTVFTGNWGPDLLLLLKAASDGGVKARFATYFLDQPGTLASAGASALGHYVSTTAVPEATNSEWTAVDKEFAAENSGALPQFIQGQTIQGLMFFGQAYQSLKAGDRVPAANELAVAIEKTVLRGPYGEVAMRAQDHQMSLPIVVARVGKDARDKIDGTDMGFKPVRIVSGKDALDPLQQSCAMQRPN